MCSLRSVLHRQSQGTRGATSVHYAVLVGAALLAVVGFRTFAVSVGKKAGCLGGTVETLRAGLTGSCEGSAASAPSAPVSGGAAVASGPGADARCDRDGKCDGGSCFAAGTPVWTAQGARAIESIAVGELVAASDPESGEVRERRVLRTMQRHVHAIVEVRVTRAAAPSETVITTHEHPFWVRGRGWVSATELAPLDVLASPGGETVVASLQERADERDVYNLEVEDLHTYFVGAANVLVHNDCDKVKGKPGEGEGEGGALNLGRGPLRLMDDLGDMLGAESAFRTEAKAGGESATTKLAKRVVEGTNALAAKFERADPRPLRPAPGMDGAMEQLRRLNDAFRPPNRKLDGVELGVRDPKLRGADVLRNLRNPDGLALLSQEAVDRLQRLKASAEEPRRDFRLRLDDALNGASDGSRRYALQLAFEQNDGYAKLANVLNGASSAEEKEAAAALLGPMIKTFDVPYRRDTDLERARAAYLAFGRGNIAFPGARSAAPASPLDADVTKKLYAKNFLDELTLSRKDADAPLAKLSKLLYARELAQHPQYAGNVNVEALEAQLKEEFEKPAVLKKLNALHETTTAAVKASEDYKDHLAMLGSKAFSDALAAMRPEDAAKTMQAELTKVTLVDPVRARELAMQVQRNLALDHGMKAVEVHIEDLIRQANAKDAEFAKVAKGFKMAPDTIKRFSKVASEILKELGKEAGAVGPARMAAIADEAVKSAKLSAKESAVFKLLKFADENGRFSALATTLGALATLDDMSRMSTTKDYIKFGAGVGKLIDGLEGLSKFGASTFGTELKTANNITRKELYKAGVGRWARIAAHLKLLGPIADFASAVADGMSAYENFQKGKMQEFFCDATMAASSGVCAVAGLLFVLGASTGPAAPIVLAVGTVV